MSGMPGELVPTVNVADLSLCGLSIRHPRGTLMDLREIVHESGLMEKLRANHETQTLFQT
jgi:hypothetical protein